MTAIQLQAWFALPHAWLGGLALISYWFAALAGKGSGAHRLAGRVFLLAMVGVVLTALPLSVATWLNGHVIWAVFLAYLVVLVSVNCLNAWRAVRHRNSFEHFANGCFRAGAIVLGLAGLATVALGLIHGAILLIAFGAIGPLAAWQSLRLSRRGPSDGRWWLRSHYGAMIGNGVATHIAFFQIGLARLFADLGMAMIVNIAWLGPLVVGALIGYLLDRRWGRSKKPRASLAPAASNPLAGEAAASIHPPRS
ncbi:MAG: hypothetical protein EA370_01185 [Wenzhouxiangella sp.]|nr:MAG: hypothetical protein EA370_01185 [Wenzhouxiangella sp.]